MRTSKHRFIPEDELDLAIRARMEPEFCRRCECVLDCTESAICNECDDAEYQRELEWGDPCDWESEP